MDPRGKKFDQKTARDYAKLDQLIIICGHYEGVDERVHEHLVDEAVSVGDFVLTGGEIPAMVIVDAVTRLIPGVLSKEEAIEQESFRNTGLQEDRYLEYPQYTRPDDFNGWKVPEVLLSGNHREINKWRDGNKH
jgi:tRNA (guanine37-N1)-methyltransferase